MAEILDKDILIKILRYINAKEGGSVNGLPIPVRISTYEVGIKLLQKEGLIGIKESLTKKGKTFLKDNKIENTFVCQFTSFGFQYASQNCSQMKKILDVLNKRPEPNYELDHQPLLPELTIMRAQYIASEENLFDKKVAFVGDYDSVHIALNMTTKLAASTVFDIDTRLVKFFQKMARENDYELEAIECDIFKYNPRDYMGKFDVFVTDPPYAMKGMAGFIEFAISLLKDGGVGFIAVPFHDSIGWTERLMYEINHLVLQRNCVVTDINKYFHNYQTADGLKSSMIRIKKGVQDKVIDMEKFYSYKPVNINYPDVKVESLFPVI